MCCGFSGPSPSPEAPGVSPLPPSGFGLRLQVDVGSSEGPKCFPVDTGCLSSPLLTTRTSGKGCPGSGRHGICFSPFFHGILETPTSCPCPAGSSGLDITAWGERSLLGPVPPVMPKGPCWCLCSFVSRGAVTAPGARTLPGAPAPREEASSHPLVLCTRPLPVVPNSVGLRGDPVHRYWPSRLTVPAPGPRVDFAVPQLCPCHVSPMCGPFCVVPPRGQRWVRCVGGSEEPLASVLPVREDDATGFSQLGPRGEPVQGTQGVAEGTVTGKGSSGPKSVPPRWSHESGAWEGPLGVSS